MDCRNAPFDNEVYRGIIKAAPRINDKLPEVDMETMKLKAHIGTDGILQIETLTNLKDTSVEVVMVVQPLSTVEVAPSEEAEARYNAWGKPITKKSISNAITRMQQLRREVALDKASIRSMIEAATRCSVDLVTPDENL